MSPGAARAVLLAGMLAVLVASTVLTRVELSWLTALLGLVLVVYSGLSLAGVRFSIGPDREIWLGPLFGVVLVQMETK